MLTIVPLCQRYLNKKDWGTFFNSFHKAGFVFFKPNDVNRSNESSETNTEYTGGPVGTEKEFDRARHAELYSMLYRLYPKAQSTAPGKPSAVEEWI